MLIFAVLGLILLGLIMLVAASAQSLVPDIFLPFLAAALYCASIMLVKCASASGRLSGVSALVINNFIAGAAFAPLIFVSPLPGDLVLLWQPLLVGLLCSAGNVATFICAERGEISLMTPIMGMKMIFVIVFAGAFLDAPLPSSIVAAGVICCVAVFIMGFERGSLKSRKIAFTVSLAVAACLCYAACDVLIQKFAPNFSKGAMVGFMTVVMPFSVLPFAPRFLREAAASGRRELSLGVAAGALMVLEMFLMILAISGPVGASLCNILYNTRGIMSIVFVYLLGRKFAPLKELSGASAAQRAAGAAMILAAVFMVLY